MPSCLTAFGREFNPGLLPSSYAVLFRPKVAQVVVVASRNSTPCSRDANSIIITRQKQQGTVNAEEAFLNDVTSTMVPGACLTVFSRRNILRLETYPRLACSVSTSER